MNEGGTSTILKLRLQYERHVVHARQRARDIAGLLGFDRLEQVRLATATSELARNAFRYAREGTVEFQITGSKPQSLQIRVTDAGPGIADLQAVLDGRYQSQTGMGKGLIGTRRLMDEFTITSSPGGTVVVAGKVLPSSRPNVSAAEVKKLSTRLAVADADPFQEVERQNQELLRTLAELREKQELLAQVNNELEDTNRGVVALYAELEHNATDLRRVSDLKTSFLSNLSHEFRTPLNSILALCQILNDRADGDLSAEQEKQVGYIRRSASDLSELVNDLLDMAKVEAGKVEVRARHFHVEELFGALRGMLRSLLVGTAVELNFSAPGDLPPIFSDEGKLSQILRNLLSNALKFTEQGHISLTARRLGDNIEFRVTDTGIGIAPEDLERIFEEFIQIESPIQSRVRGTGLGLPLARKLAQLLGGSVQVESRKGEGSVFTVEIPMHFKEPEASVPVALVREKNAPVLLLIEDNLETRFIHQAALKNTPYSLHFARNLAEARGLMNALSPAAIVLDRWLEGHDALPFIQELRGIGYRGRVLVVSVIEDRDAPMRAGADSFLVKPIAAGLLRDTLAELLRTAPGRAVLLVDDDEINRYLLREALTPFGFRIVEARSGREAIRLVAAEALAAVFLDLAMPGLSGLETLRELRERSSGPMPPVIIHTSKDLSPGEQEFIALHGALLFPKRALTEPDSFEKLRAVLTEAEAL